LRLNSGFGIITFSFGGGNETNKRLAKVTLDTIATKQNVSAFVQREVSDLLPPDIPHITIGGEKHLNIYETMLAVTQEAKKRRIKLNFAYLIAYPALLPLAKMVARKFELIPMDIPKIPKMPYPKNNLGRWKGNVFSFWFREIFGVYLYFWWKKWIDWPD
jgi:hypothetical protein